MSKYISFSGGVESTTMCILYGKGATAIWCDTGWEHDVMYDRINFCERILKELHEGDFELIRIKPKVTAKEVQVDKLQDYIESMSFMPSKMARYCTDRFKIQPIEKFLKSAGDCELMLGFNADEEPRKVRVGNLEKLKNVQYTYPLYQQGYTREMCEDILHAHGLHPEFPVYMKRGGCIGCIFKSVAEFKAMYFFNKPEFMKVLELEERIQDQRKKFFTISMSQKPMRFIMDQCESELNQWGDQVFEMYRKVKIDQSCGAFCHR
jgi:3'-phosphoadenosine 5'-phosphosulfate sulfotransferase (PAPS reductase)/FAD synthetase